MVYRDLRLYSAQERKSEEISNKVGEKSGRAVVQDNFLYKV